MGYALDIHTSEIDIIQQNTSLLREKVSAI